MKIAMRQPNWTRESYHSCSNRLARRNDGVQKQKRDLGRAEFLVLVVELIGVEPTTS